MHKQINIGLETLILEQAGTPQQSCGTAEPPEAICQEAICLPSGCPPSSCAISRVLRQFTRMGEDDRTVGRSQKDCRTKGYGRANGQVNTYAWAPW